MNLYAQENTVSTTIKMAIDVGYGYVKAINNRGDKYAFPSFIAPYHPIKLEGFDQESPGHICEIYNNDGANKYFVGERALWESNKISFTLQKKRFLHPSHDVLLQTAIGLLNSEGCATAELVLGLPIDYYRHQKEALAAHIRENLNAAICINETPTIVPDFKKLLIYPQGVGALLTVPMLPQQGRFALIDIGYKTTDYLVCKVENGRALPISQLSGSIEMGTNSILTDLIYYFEDKTGGILDYKEAMDALKNESIYYQGEVFNLKEQIGYICKNTARTIADRIMTRWGDQSNYIQKTYLAGGGAIQVPQLLNLLPHCEIVADPQWSNVYGFIKSL